MTKTEQDRIILLKGQIRTDIRSIRYSDDRRHYNVMFDNGRIFQYNSENVSYLVRCEDIPMPVRVTRISDCNVFQNILGVSTFVNERKDIKAYRVVFENGDHRDYPSGDILVEKHVKGERAKSVYGYLRGLSKFSHIDVGEDISVGLSQKYARVKMIVETSPLADYLVGGRGCVRGSMMSKGIDSEHMIFPFGCNRSQYQAVKNALENKISVIQGPPGTGKTQTILNIVANLLIAGKSMTIVSNNNSAVANIAEKMQKEKYSLSWLVAYLGNTTNKRFFYEGQSGVYPDLRNWERTDLELLRERIVGMMKRLQAGYENQEQLARLREELRQSLTQLSHVVSILGEDIGCIEKMASSRDILRMLSRIDAVLERKGRLGLFFRWKLRRKGIIDLEKGQKMLQRTFYQRKIEELQVQISKIEPAISEIRQDEGLLEEYSLQYLRGVLFKMFHPIGGERKVFSQNEVERNNPQAFLKEYPVVLSTTFSATTNVNQGVPYDYLIMDEASQVDVSAGALAMNVSRNAVIVGDEKQLPNVVTTDDRIAADMLLKQYDIPSYYDFARFSFLGSLCAVYPNMPTTMLREHYRCSPTIIGFCNRQFYGESLIAMTSESSYPSMRICTTGEGNYARGMINRRQAEMIVREIIPDIRKMFSDIGVIAPYNDQVGLIREELAAEGIEDIPVATVHKFQGRENDVIILSTVDNQISKFVDDSHLLNVAVSRAKKLFILVVSGNEQPDSNVKDLYEYIKYNNGEVFTTRLLSVFDLLYSQKTEERKKFLTQSQKDSKFDSENLMFVLLESILGEGKYQRYGFVAGYPLNILIPEEAPLNEIEYEFVHRTWSHLDFLIYDKVSHSPVVAIEVDGTSFHFKGSDQYDRDRIKDSALQKVGLPLLRLTTDGSGEKERIIATLDQSRNSLFYMTVHDGNNE